MRLRNISLGSTKKSKSGLTYPTGPYHAEFVKDGRGETCQDGHRREEMSFLDSNLTRDSLLARIGDSGNREEPTYKLGGVLVALVRPVALPALVFVVFLFSHQLTD